MHFTRINKYYITFKSSKIFSITIKLIETFLNPFYYIVIMKMFSIQSRMHWSPLTRKGIIELW